MSMKIKQLISATLTMIMIFSLFSGKLYMLQMLKPQQQIVQQIYALNSLFLKVHPEIII